MHGQLMDIATADVAPISTTLRRLVALALREQAKADERARKRATIAEVRALSQTELGR